MLIKENVSIQIYYYIPDHKYLINEFFWQTQDIVPELPRIHQFLHYWHENIDAIIKEVLISHSNKIQYQNVIKELKC